MKTSMLVCVSIVTVAAASLHARAADAAPTAREPGDLWEVTTSMSMEGMNVPMPAQKVCSPREWNKPPVNSDEKSKCETIDFSHTANKASWKMKCAGPPPMTGEGEITRMGTDAYKGWMKMTSPQGVMTMTLAGKKIGDCDAAEQKRQTQRMVAQAEAGQKMAADATKQMCQAPIESMDLRSMSMMSSVCSDPEIKTAFCKRLDSVDGFKLVCTRKEQDPENGLTKIAAYCGRDAEALRTGACKIGKDKEDLELIGNCCPVEAKELATRECAGRDYTSLMGTKYQNFCVQYARDVMTSGAQGDDAKKDEPETSKTKKILKGLFKR